MSEKPAEKPKEKILIKIKKINPSGHHGGAWKIAYADFVTAMMAFFLLLWLLNATESEAVGGVSNYFEPTLNKTSGHSGSGGVGGGQFSSEESEIHDGATDIPTATNASSLSTQDVNTVEHNPSPREGFIDIFSLEVKPNQIREELKKVFPFIPQNIVGDSNVSMMSSEGLGVKIEIIKDPYSQCFLNNPMELSPETKDNLNLFVNMVKQSTTSAHPPSIYIFIYPTPNQEQSTQPVDIKMSFQKALTVKQFFTKKGIDEDNIESLILMHQAEYEQNKRSSSMLCIKVILRNESLVKNITQPSILS